MKKVSILVFIACLIIGCKNQSVNLLPNPKADIQTNLFGQYYFECPKCKSLDGGYYGKGSVSSWRSQTGTKCQHDWKEISKELFAEKWLKETGNNEHY